jgi:hypothetical protein
MKEAQKLVMEVLADGFVYVDLYGRLQSLECALGCALHVCSHIRCVRNHP